MRLAWIRRRLSERHRTLKILVVRPDRMGDVILSTPVLGVIKEHYPHATVTMLVREPVVPLLKDLPSLDEVMVFAPEGKHRGLRGLALLVDEIHSREFRIAVHLQVHWKIALAVFLARVRYRVGPLSRLFSFVLFNRGIRQRRSRVEMHEADYNLQLLRRIGIRVRTRTVPVQVNISDQKVEQAKQWLRAQGWNEAEPLIAIHPGMGGSALNWPETHYLELIRVLLREGRQILVTAGPSEFSLLQRMKEGVGFPKPDRIWFYGSLDEKQLDATSIDSLGALFSCASVVVAPSTGPLHLAVALGKAVVTFYPPIRVQSANRWGPYVKDETRAAVLVPEVYCGEDFKCRGSVCHSFPCMKSLSVTQALEQVNRLLALY